MSRVRYALLLWFAATAGAQDIYSIAGIPYSHRDSVDGAPALNAPLLNVHGLLIDNVTGRLLFSDGSLVSRVEPDGTLLALVGRGMTQFGATTNGIPASFLGAQGLSEMAQDSTGALYVSDIFAGHVYRIGLDGTVTTFAGGGTLPAGFASDGGPATSAQLQSPRGLVFDSQGNLDIAEVFCGCIRRVSPTGTISTVYSFPLFTAPDTFTEIEGLSIDAQDNLYFTEWMGAVVVQLSPNGTATTIAGTGVAGFSGDGGPATAAQLNGPSSVALAADGSIYIADSGNNRVRRVALDGTISTVAGTGSTISNLNNPAPACSFSGDGGPAVNAQLCEPAQVLFDSTGNLYVSDYGNRRVRRIAPDGTISTIAGNGQPDPDTSNPGSSGNGGPPIHATFYGADGSVFDAAGNLYVSESLGSVIRKISPSGTVSTFAGTGQTGYSGDGGPATQAMLFHPGPLAIDPDGNLFVITADSRVRKISPDGIISLVAGTGTGSGTNRAQGDGGPAIDATLNEPGEVAFDTQGNIYIADTSNARLRKIDSSGIITTIAGPGVPGTDYYNAVAVDPQGNILLGWTHAAVYPLVTTNQIIGTVNRVNPDGSLTPVVGNGQPCTGGPFGSNFAYDGKPALQAQLCEVTAMTIDAKGVMYLPYGGQMLEVTTDGIIHVVAGNGLATLLGDGGPALQASIGGPGAPTFDAAGDMYFADTGFDVIREVTATNYAARLSLNQIGLVGTQGQSWGVATSANFAEPFPYTVNVTGGSWLSVNRATGLIGEPFTVTLNPTGLAPGFYQGTVSVNVGTTTSGGIGQVNLPIELLVPSSIAQ